MIQTFAICSTLISQKLLSAVFFQTFWWKTSFLWEQEILYDKQYNNHSVSWPPPGLRFQFCTAVPWHSHELTYKFFSRQLGSPLLQPCDSLLLKQFLKGWKIIQPPRDPSLPATCGSSRMWLPCMSDEPLGAFRPLQWFPSITFTSCFLNNCHVSYWGLFFFNCPRSAVFFFYWVWVRT